MSCYLLSDPEDIAWLLNVRTLDRMTPSSNGWQIVPAPLSRLLIEMTGDASWFIDGALLEPALRARLEGSVTLVDPTQFESFLRDRTSGKLVGANLAKTPHRFASIVAQTGTLKHDPIV